MARIEVVHLSKQFPAVQALDDVSLTIESGEVHGIVGENGAGKSTLMKILAGLDSPNAGEVRLDGRPLHLRSARDALAEGIVMIHQELNLVDDLDVAENVFLGREPSRFGMIERQRMVELAGELLNRVGAGFGPGANVGRLSIAGKQLVEIAKAISHDARVLIMDEPTAVLTERECATLLGLIAELKRSGVTVIYVSHLLPEVLEACDRISVLRDGRLVETIESDGATERGLAERMVGRELGDMFPKRANVAREPLLHVLDMDVPGYAEGIELRVDSGEIVGIAGLVGAGRTEVCEAIAGLRSRSGEVRIIGGPLKRGDPIAAKRAGLGYISEDRKGKGLVLGMSVVHNTTLANLREYSAVVIDRTREREATDTWIKKLSIRAGDPRGQIAGLSGGNQQKVAVAKWLETNPKLLLLDEPTRGIDIGAKREMYALIATLAEAGLGCLVVSSEMLELTGLCDRVYVMRAGRIVGELQGESISEHNIIELAAGVEAKSA